MPLETLDAGPELDAIIAEKVMGWRFADREAMGWGDGPPVVITNDEESPTRQGWSPSTDIAAAAQVLDRLGGIVTVKRLGAHEWHVTIGNADTRWAETLPRAICLAAMEATNV